MIFTPAYPREQSAHQPPTWCKAVASADTQDPPPHPKAGRAVWRT